MIRAIRTALHSVVGANEAGATHNSSRFPSTREDASSPTGLPLIYRFRRFWDSQQNATSTSLIHWFFCAPSADTALPDSGGLSRAPRPKRSISSIRRPNTLSTVAGPSVPPQVPPQPALSLRASTLTRRRTTGAQPPSLYRERGLPFQA